MLANYEVWAMIPAQDLERARRFYSGKLGLDPSEERPEGLRYVSGGGSFLLFQSTGKASGTHTQLGWNVDDLDKVVADLRSRGVEFETYDLPGFKTDANGIAEIDGERGAWFKDSEGNLLALGQRIGE